MATSVVELANPVIEQGGAYNFRVNKIFFLRLPEGDKVLTSSDKFLGTWDTGMDGVFPADLKRIGRLVLDGGIGSITQVD